MKKHNWIIEPTERNATPTPWGIANNIKFCVMSAEEHDLFDPVYNPNGYNPVRAAKQVKYYASMTDIEAAAFKLAAADMSIARAKW